MFPPPPAAARGREQASGYCRGPEDEHDFTVGDGPNRYPAGTYTVHTTAVRNQDEHGRRWDDEAGVAVELVRRDVI